MSTRSIAPVVLLLLAISASAPVEAQLFNRSFVASYGSDTNTCQLATPCRTFAVAAAHTNDGGEIVVIDTAGYGPVSINKSLSIIAPEGVHAGITVSTGAGVTVNGTGISVALRGLTITGAGGLDGIVVEDSAEVFVDRCIVSGMVDDGLFMYAHNALLVRDSIFRDNGRAGVRQSFGYATYEGVRIERNGEEGLRIENDAAAVARGTFFQNFGSGIHGQAPVSVDASVVHGNRGNGISVIHGSVSRTVVDGNGGDGVLVFALGNATISNTIVTRNGTLGTNAGISVASGSTATLNAVTVADNNDKAIDGFAASVRTRGNDSIDGAITGTLTLAPLQ